MAYTIDRYYDSLLANYEREQDEGQRYQDAAERAAIKLGDELARIRRLNDHDRLEQMTALVSDLLNETGGLDWLDDCIEKLSEDTDEKRTELVMRWAGETEYLP